MNATRLVAAIAVCALSGVIVSAQNKSVPVELAMSTDMDKRMWQLQENMKTMQGQTDNIQQTTNLEERQRLLQAHIQAMQEKLKAMRSMGGPMIRGGQYDDMTASGVNGGMQDRFMM